MARYKTPDMPGYDEDFAARRAAYAARLNATRQANGLPAVSEDSISSPGDPNTRPSRTGSARMERGGQVDVLATKAAPPRATIAPTIIPAAPLAGRQGGLARARGQRGTPIARSSKQAGPGGLFMPPAAPGGMGYPAPDKGGRGFEWIEPAAGAKSSHPYDRAAESFKVPSQKKQYWENLEKSPDPAVQEQLKGSQGYQEYLAHKAGGVFPTDPETGQEKLTGRLKYERQRDQDLLQRTELARQGKTKDVRIHDERAVMQFNPDTYGIDDPRAVGRVASIQAAVARGELEPDAAVKELDRIARVHASDQVTEADKQKAMEDRGEAAIQRQTDRQAKVDKQADEDRHYRRDKDAYQAAGSDMDRAQRLLDKLDKDEAKEKADFEVMNPGKTYAPSQGNRDKRARLEDRHERADQERERFEQKWRKAGQADQAAPGETGAAGQAGPTGTPSPLPSDHPAAQGMQPVVPITRGYPAGTTASGGSVTVPGEPPAPSPSPQTPAPAQAPAKTAAGFTPGMSPQEILAMAQPARPSSLLQPATIDTSKLPAVDNPDGTKSTVRSITIESDGQFVNIPTVIGGKVVSNDQAIAEWRKHPDMHLGIFADQDSAIAGAQALHASEEARIAGPEERPTPWADQPYRPERYPSPMDQLPEGETMTPERKAMYEKTVEYREARLKKETPEQIAIRKEAGAAPVYDPRKTKLVVGKIYRNHAGDSALAARYLGDGKFEVILT